MKIAIIDDGVNTNYFANVNELSFNLTVNKHNKIVRRINYDKTIINHGTTCAAIIKKYAPTAKIGSIKVISDETMRGNSNHLITALNWCLENDIKLIHLSIGSILIQDIEPITAVVKKLLQNNCIIVAALANTMKFSVPACIDDVFGVKTYSGLKDDEFFVSECGLYDVPFVSSSKHLLLDRKGEEYITPQCNSYSAPLITAKLYNLLEQQPTISISKLQLMFGIKTNSTYQQKLQNTPFISEEFDAPIICIVGEKERVISATIQLNKLFLKNGYHCKPFTTLTYIKQDDITTIPSNITQKKLLAFYTNRLSLSVILVATEDIEYLNLTPDAIIYLVPNKKNNRYNGDTIYIPEKYSKGNLLRVVKYFEKDNS